MRATRGRLGAGFVLGAALLAHGCSSPAAPSSGPSPVPETTTTLVSKAVTDVVPGATYISTVTVPEGGRLTATFSWTFPGDEFSVSWDSGACPSCSSLISSATTASPTSGSATVAVSKAGPYSFVFQSASSNPKEAISLHITLTSP
jgi:hypothetical protein